MLAPGRLVPHVDAIVLSGGSVFGLAAADGVTEWLEASERGFPTRHGRVPIVVGMALFDLGIGDATARPKAEHGKHAAANASADAAQNGQVGAGTGATVDGWQGVEKSHAGLGSAVHRDSDLVVAALVAVNAAGAVDDGETVAGIRSGAARPRPADEPFGNTTLGVVVTNARLDKLGCHLVAQGAHDGYARAITPPHLRTDGDAVVAAATGSVDADVDWVRTLSMAVVADAIRSAVASPAGQ
jgi:L-aminopeptidase/D-esterase-like protein